MNTVKFLTWGLSVIALAAASGAAAKKESSELDMDGRNHRIAQRDSVQQQSQSQSHSQQLGIRQLIGRKVSDSQGEQLGDQRRGS